MNYWLTNAKENIDGYIHQVDTDFVGTHYGDPQGLHCLANAITMLKMYDFAKRLHALAEDGDKISKLNCLREIKFALAEL